MIPSRNQFRVVAFDPGGTTGWAALAVHKRAFVSPQAKLLPNIIKWGTGEFEGTEREQLQKAVNLIHRTRYDRQRHIVDCDIVSEDFDLVQLIGGKDLLSPVRINAVLEWECQNKYALPLNLQNRSHRTNVTAARLQLWQLWPCKGKDSFAAMQHAVTWLRRIKLKANERPWKLDEGD